MLLNGARQGKKVQEKEGQADECRNQTDDREWPEVGVGADSVPKDPAVEKRELDLCQALAAGIEVVDCEGRQ